VNDDIAVDARSLRKRFENNSANSICRATFARSLHLITTDRVLAIKPPRLVIKVEREREREREKESRMPVLIN